MVARSLFHGAETRRLTPFQLGWSGFWLLGVILFGMLAIAGFLLFGGLLQLQ